MQDDMMPREELSGQHTGVESGGFPASPRQSANPPQQPNSYIISISILVAGILISGAVMYSAKTGSTTKRDSLQANVGNAAGAAVDSAALADDDPALGSPDASVTVVEFADFQCPFCGRFHSGAGKKIIDQYVKTGKATFVYRDFAFLGEESQWAAEAAECADDQGKFWQYHDYLFTHQNGENQGAFAKDKLISFAAAVGLETNQFKSCLDASTHAAEVKKDTEDGQKFGVGGTPATFINGKMIPGAQDFAVFQQAIEEALKNK